MLISYFFTLNNIHFAQNWNTEETIELFYRDYLKNLTQW